MNNVWLWLDMDGTIADFYGVRGWIESLGRKDTKPYREARAIYNGHKMIRLLKEAKELGFNIGVISWSAKDCEKEYHDRITIAKKKWLERHGFLKLLDAIEITAYGKSKSNTCKKYGAGILFDDDLRNIENWTLGKAIDASANNLLKVIKSLLGIPKSELIFTDRARKKDEKDALSETRFLVLDTETANGQYDEKVAKVDLSQSLVYDFGYAIVDTTGKVLLSRSFIIREVFCDKNLMNSAYYKDKISRYWDDIKIYKTRRLVNFWTAYETFQNDIRKYNITFCSAHNALFDINALNNTIRVLTGSRVRYFFKYGLTVLDTLRLAQNTICKREEYINFCWENGYLTRHKTPRVRATAEVLFRYLTNDISFIESHTGLEDVLIEKDILTECFKELKARY